MARETASARRDGSVAQAGVDVSVATARANAGETYGQGLRRSVRLGVEQCVEHASAIGDVQQRWCGSTGCIERTDVRLAISQRSFSLPVRGNERAARRGSQEADLWQTAIRLPGQEQLLLIQADEVLVAELQAERE